MGDVTPKAQVILPEPPACPPNYKFGTIAELYEQYEARLEGSCVIDPCGQENWFYAENFPHLVKLEFFNSKINQWVDARAKEAIHQLKSKCLDESRYRIGDASRPRTLFWVPEVIINPDSIHENIRANGTDVYCKRYKRFKGSELKIVLVGRRDASTRVVMTSFWSNSTYHNGCIRIPAKHPNPK